MARAASNSAPGPASGSASDPAPGGASAPAPASGGDGPGDGYPLDAPSSHPAAEIAAAWRRERPAVPIESIPIVTPIFRLAKHFADDRRRVLAAAGVDGATLDLLSALRRSGPPYTLGTRELAARALVTAGAISQRVARAERAGLVVRRPDGTRPRAVQVTLTDAGHAEVERVVDHVLAREASLVAGLTPDQRTALEGLLDVLLSDVRARLAPP